jgi:uncharacterized membrane protein YkvA (DUF1232 family)
VAWWEWPIAAAGIVVALAGFAVWLVRRTARGRAILQLSPREKLRFGRALMRDRAMPRAARILLLALIAYLISPIDLVPDFVPVLGQLDDLLLVCAVLLAVLWLVPGERIDAAIVAARAAPSQGGTVPSTSAG